MNDLQEVPARRGFSLSYQGKTLLSRFDPVAQSERITRELHLEEGTLYFCPSPLYGYGLSLLLERLKNEIQSKKSAILCIEADEKLFELSQKAMTENEEKWPSYLKDKSLALIKISLRKAAPDVCAFVRKIFGERRFRRVEQVRLNGGWQLFPQLYNDIETAIRHEIAQQWGNAMTLIRLGRLYAKNLILNLSNFNFSDTVIDSASIDFGISPVLVLGAGPSLDPLLDELFLLWDGKIPDPPKRCFKIVCVDSCLPALIERKIQPDFVVILESQHWNLRAFTGLKGRRIDAVLDLSSLPASARVLGGRNYFYATAWTELSLFGRLEKAGLLPKKIAPLGSVGLNAVALALGNGLGPVITSGIDFSYSMDASHARSTPGHKDKEIKQNRLKSIITVSAFRDGTFSAVSKTGKHLKSDPAMRNYRDLFEQEFGGESRLYDIIGEGLNLGIKTLSPKEAFSILKGDCRQYTDNPPVRDISPNSDEIKHNKNSRLIDFIHDELGVIKNLKEMLTGAIPVEPERLEELLDITDYLWAHFPECAGAGGSRPPASDLSFLKRVRIEIEPFLKYWEMSLEELT